MHAPWQGAINCITRFTGEKRPDQPFSTKEPASKFLRCRRLRRATRAVIAGLPMGWPLVYGKVLPILGDAPAFPRTPPASAQRTLWV